MGEQHSAVLYRQLRAGEFRLLLLREDEQNDFTCELRHLNIDTHLAYVALSYTWGDSRDRIFITLDSHRVLIRKNLAEALQRLFRLGHRVVWADALCINQNDLAERGAQVSLMRNIFERAQEVVIWLESISNLPSIPALISDLLCAPSLTTTSFIEGAGAIIADPDSYFFLQDLLKSGYWQRAWIIQEVAVASEVNVIASDQRIPWANLSILARVLQSIHTISEVANITKFAGHLFADLDVEDGAAWLFTLDIIRKRKGDSLLSVLDLSAGSKQREDIDVVYSKLGLAFDAPQLLPQPDYTRTFREVCVDLACNYIREKRSLKIVCCASLHAHEQLITHQEAADLRLPTWVPDWRLVQEFTFISIVTVRSPELVFRAAGDIEADFRLLPNVGVETLVVKGFTLDVCRRDGTPAASNRSQPARASRSTTKTALEVTASFCRTVFANHLLLHDFSCAEVLTSHDLALFRRLLHQYYMYGSLPLAQHQNAGGVGQSRYNKRLSYLQEMRRRFDSWADLLIHGSSLNDWVSACRLPDPLGPSFQKTVEDVERVGRLVYSLVNILGRRKIMGSESGRIFLVPEHTQVGDKICILAGCDFPVALSKQRWGKHTVVGCCYVDGIMHGEAMREYLVTHSTLVEFHLI